MAAPKMNVSVDEISPRQEQKQNSFFRRIFCLSPKASQSKLETARKLVNISMEPLAEEEKSNKQVLVVPQQIRFQRDTSQLSLKLNPTDLITQPEETQKIPDKEVTNPEAKEIPQNESPTKNKASPRQSPRLDANKRKLKVVKPKSSPKSQVKPKLQEQAEGSSELLNIIKDLSPKKELWEKLEKTFKEQKSPKHKEISQNEGLQAQQTNQDQLIIEDQNVKQDDNQSKDNHQPILSTQQASLLKTPSGSNLINHSLSSNTLEESVISQRDGLRGLNRSIKVNETLQIRLNEIQHPTYRGKIMNQNNDQIKSTVRLKQKKQRKASEDPTIIMKSKSKMDSMILSSKLSNYESTFSRDTTSRNIVSEKYSSKVSSQSQTVNSALLHKQKIQQIIDIQKQNNNKKSLMQLSSKAEINLFHKSPYKQRSKSVIKSSYGKMISSPYESRKLLPKIFSKGRHQDIQYALDSSVIGPEYDDSQFQSALDRYTNSTTAYNKGENILSHASSRNEINLTFDQALPASYQTSPKNSIETDMRAMLNELQNQDKRNQQFDFSSDLQNSQPIVFLSIVNLMMKHQIFKKMAKSSVKTLLQECCQIMVMKKGQILYKEEDEDRNAYIVVYGSLVIWNKKNGQLGKSIAGFSVGEESFCDKNYVCRLDNCYAEQETCIFCVERAQWLAFKSLLDPKDAVLIKDSSQLDEVLKRNYIIKKGWRNGGISKIIQGKKVKDFLNNTVDL